MLVTIVATLALAPQHKHHKMMHGNKKAMPVNEEPAIRATVKKVEHAMETKNVGAFRMLCTPDFQQELPNHQVLSLKQMMNQMKKGFAPLYDIKANIMVQRIDPTTGNKSMIDDRYMIKGMFKDKKGTHNMRIEGSETVSIKKVRGTWMAYYLKTHDESVSVDGHVVSHMP
jgi:hypothetical protein